MNYQNTLEFAKSLDEKDDLKDYRSKFYIPQHQQKDCIYFTGNSLGLQPKTVSTYIQQELNDWALLGVDGHFQAKNPWMPYHENFTQQIANIVGAKESEVVVMNQLTVNLHLLMVSFYKPNKNRFKIICEAKAFPSDQYAIESQVKFHGLNPDDTIIEIHPKEGSYCLKTEDILQAIYENKDEVALVLMGGVNYYTGQFFDLQTITKAAHEVGAFAGFDLAHAAGNVELKLNEWDVDFACWCSYKYLNSGPGGISGVYINEKHVVNKNIQRFAGWWGYEKETRFKMQKGFLPIPTAEGWQLSNAPVLLMAAHKASLDIFEQAGMNRLFKKSKLLSGYLHFILAEINLKFGIKKLEVITPENDKERGCQVSIVMLERGKEIFNELTQKGVIADWREPNVIRVAPVPLYNTFEDVFSFGKIIEEVLTNKK